MASSVVGTSGRAMLEAIIRGVEDPQVLAGYAVGKLKKKYDFTLIGSGGINSAVEAAKALALGADLVASARIVLQTLDKHDVKGVENLITEWFDYIKKVMYLTGSSSLKELRKNKLIDGEKIH